MYCVCIDFGGICGECVDVDYEMVFVCGFVVDGCVVGGQCDDYIDCFGNCVVVEWCELWCMGVMSGVEGGCVFCGCVVYVQLCIWKDGCECFCVIGCLFVGVDQQDVVWCGVVQCLDGECGDCCCVVIGDGWVVECEVYFFGCCVVCGDLVEDCWQFVCVVVGVYVDEFVVCQVVGV